MFDTPGRFKAGLGFFAIAASDLSDQDIHLLSFSMCRTVTHIKV